MTEFEIYRDGQSALAFTGELLKDLSSKGSHGDTQNRWHEVQLYEVEGGGYVAAVCYRSLWQNEEDAHAAYDTATAAGLLDELRGHDPTTGILGRPERSEAERERNGPHNKILYDGIRRRWAGLISEAAKALGVVERIGKRPEGRPPELGGPSSSLTMRVPDADLSDVDRLRGEASRSDWIRDAIRERVARLDALTP